jgi:PAS domain-containing protein
MHTPAAKVRHPRLQQRILQAIDIDGSTIDVEALLDLVQADYAAADAAQQMEAHLIQRAVHEGLSLDGLKEATFRARSAQARMDAVLEHASEAVITCSAEGMILAFNAAAERMYDWTADEVVGRHISKILDGEWDEERSGWTRAGPNPGVGSNPEHARTDGASPRRDRPSTWRSPSRASRWTGW